MTTMTNEVESFFVFRDGICMHYKLIKPIRIIWKLFGGFDIAHLYQYDLQLIMASNSTEKDVAAEIGILYSIFPDCDMFWNNIDLEKCEPNYPF